MSLEGYTPVQRRQSVGGRWRARTAQVVFWCLLVSAGAFAAEDPASTPEAHPVDPLHPALEAPGDAVIPPGQEDLLAGMLGRGGTLPAGCALEAAEADHALVKATYTCPTGPVVFELQHPSKAPEGAARTERFAITLVSGSPPSELQNAVQSLIRSRETDFKWKFLEPASPPSSRPPIGLVAAALLGIAALGWVVRRRMSARRASPS